MPETIDTAKEIITIKRDIKDIKQSQEADMQFKRADYEKLVSSVLKGSVIRVKAFLEVNGQKTMKEIQDNIGENQSATSKAFDKLEEYGLILKTEESRNRSPIYAKPRWANLLRMDDYVRRNFETGIRKEPEVQPSVGSSDTKPDS